MKLLALIIFILLQVILVNAQRETITRLKYKLSIVTNEADKSGTLDSLSMYYLFFTNKPDSSFYYINELINYAFDLKDKKYLILAYARMGFYYVNISQYQAALDISVKGIRLSEQYDIADYLSTLYYNNAWVYYNFADTTAAFENAFDGIATLKNNKDQFLDQAVHLNGMIGNIYLDNNKSDSAYYYFDKMSSLANNSKELAAKDISDWYWSMYYLANEKYPKADSILAIGIASCEKNGDFLLNVFHLFAAQSFYAQGRIREAIREANKAYTISLAINDKGDANGSADLLYSLYNKLGKKDSAFYYLKTSDSLHVVIASRGTVSQIQQIKFNRELGQKEEAANKLLQDQKNRNKITIYVFVTALIFFLIIAIIQWRNNKQKKKANLLLQQQKEKSDELLLNILPSEVADELKEKGYTTARSFDEVTVLFSDIKGFTHVAEKLTAQELVKEIDTYFSAFDRIMKKYGLEKIKTIGDAYIAAGGLPEKNAAKAEDVIRAAIEMQQMVETLKKERASGDKPYFELRIGIHSGPVVAGVVGIKKFQYDIWGDTVNLAARMEQSGVPGKINISDQTYEIVKDKFHCIPRGKVEAKNKGEVNMYFVE